MEDDEEVVKKVPKRKVVLIFSILFGLGYVASTLAANITINSNNRVEFGQGVYNLKACDDFVRINLNYTSYDSQTATYKLNQIQLSGFDTSKCINKFFAIKILGSNSTPLDIIHDPVNSPTTVTQKIVLHVLNDASVRLVYTYGGSEGSDMSTGGDSYQNVSYSSGIYSINLLVPYLDTGQVTGTTFQSAGVYASLA